MTISQDSRDQFIESVNECLDIAQVSLSLWKSDGTGVFGYPAALLLLCAIDAMGHNFPKNERERLGLPKDLGILAYPGFDFRISRDQIPILYQVYRNQLAHRGRIIKGNFLRGESDGKPFGFAATGKLNEVYVLPFYTKVREFWTTFGKSLFPSENDAGPSTYLNPITLVSLMAIGNGGGMSSVTPAASGVAVPMASGSVKSDAD
jgi:hypothetical protein